MAAATPMTAWVSSALTAAPEMLLFAEKSERTAGSAAVLSDLLGASEAHPLVLLDLNTPGVNLADLIPALRDAANPPRSIIAYGPHVHEDRLAAAAAAGCDEVLTRGQFNARMDDLLAKWRTTGSD